MSLQDQQKKVREEFNKKFCVSCMHKGLAVIDNYKGITAFLDTQIAEAYIKGYWNRKADDKEAKEYAEAEEAHRTEEGYCCACLYDMSVMAAKIEKEVERRLSLLKRNK